MPISEEDTAEQLHASLLHLIAVSRMQTMVVPSLLATLQPGTHPEMIPRDCFAKRLEAPEWSRVIPC